MQVWMLNPQWRRGWWGEVAHQPRHHGSLLAPKTWRLKAGFPGSGWDEDFLSTWFQSEAPCDWRGCWVIPRMRLWPGNSGMLVQKSSCLTEILSSLFKVLVLSDVDICPGPRISNYPSSHRILCPFWQRHRPQEKDLGPWKLQRTWVCRKASGSAGNRESSTEGSAPWVGRVPMRPGAVSWPPTAMTAPPFPSCSHCSQFPVPLRGKAATGHNRSEQLQGNRSINRRQTSIRKSATYKAHVSREKNPGKTVKGYLEPSSYMLRKCPLNPGGADTPFPILLISSPVTPGAFMPSTQELVSLYLSPPTFVLCPFHLTFFFHIVPKPCSQAGGS